MLSKDELLSERRKRYLVVVPPEGDMNERWLQLFRRLAATKSITFRQR